MIEGRLGLHSIIIIIVCILSQYIILTLIVVYKLLEPNFHKVHNIYCKFYPL